ncbi:MAG: hypothetical protein IT370_11200 [Deltaproteobacteria bacterium]|nr:hypothetical protein [Deltaproteobacteria bacterium]
MRTKKTKLPGAVKKALPTKPGNTDDHAVRLAALRERRAALEARAEDLFKEEEALERKFDDLEEEEAEIDNEEAVLRRKMGKGAPKKRRRARSRR